MGSTLFISEILNKISQESEENKKIEILRKNVSVPLKNLLFLAFSNTTKFLLPNEPATYKPLDWPCDMGDLDLYSASKKLYLFLEGGNNKLKQQKREMMYLNMLEIMSKEESEVLESIRLRTLDTKYNLDVDVVKKAFPDLLTEEQIYKNETTKTIIQNQTKKRRGRPPKNKTEKS